MSVKSAWEEALQTLKDALSHHFQVVTASTTDLETALKGYHGMLSANDRERALLRRVDHELAKSSFDLDTVIQLIVEGALQLVQAQYGDLLVPSDSGHLKILWSTRKQLVNTLIPIRGSITGKAYESKESQNPPNLRQEEDYIALIPDMESELAVPLILETNHVVGVINIESREPNAFTSHHCEVVQILAGQAAIAFRNARLYSELTGILETQSQILARTDSLRNTLALIGRRAKEMVGAEGCQVLTIRPGSEELVIEYTTGSEPLGTRVLVKDSVSGLAVRSSQVINIDDVHADPLARELYKDVLGGMRSELVVPLIANGEILGVINLESPLPGAFGNREYLVRLFANQASVAVLNARTVETLVAERQLQAQTWVMAQIGDVAGNMIHRLNSDVGAIKTLLAEIRRDQTELIMSTPRLAARLNDIDSMAKKALEVPKQLRRQLESANQYLDLNVNAAIRDVLETLDRPMGVDLDLKALDDSLPLVNTSRQFEWVLKNVIHNAYEAMPDGGVLKILTRRWDVEQAREAHLLGIEVVIADTGVGIPSDIKDHLFEFSVSRKRHAEGLGFGLWWVKLFLDRVGGEITVESVIGTGTAVSVKIPLRSRQAMWSSSAA